MIPYSGLRLDLPRMDTLSVEKKVRTPDIRTVADMAPVLREPITLSGTTPAYFMYREAAKTEHLPLFFRHGIRFDITILPELFLGSEYNKTFGHYHPDAPSGIPYPELYEVVTGQAHYLLQKRAEKSEKIESAMLVKTDAGQKALMPPGFGHVTVNTGGLLVMDNLVERTFQSNYAPYKENHGAAYYWTRNGLEKNPHYSKLPPLEEINAPELNRRYLETWQEKMEKNNNYELFVKHPEAFEFLEDFCRS